MCGQLGLLRINPSNTPEALVSARNLFTHLLLLSEHRGPLASGAAWLDTSGRHQIHKAPLPASDFIAAAGYADWLGSIPSTAVLLMGHTRWPTMGSHRVSHNNHPLVDNGRSGPSGQPSRSAQGTILVTHNGHIPNVAACFGHFGLPRRWEVDSELLLRLARRHVTSHGIDIPALLADIEQCPGHIAAVAAWAAHPETVLFIRRDRPLFLAFHARRRLVAYASERGILETALAGQDCWRLRGLRENTALHVRTDAWAKPVEYHFESPA